MNVTPSLPSTRVVNTWEWRPADFGSFVRELDAVSSVCHRTGRLALYRGHSDCRWLLDSTFVRYVKQYIFGISPLCKLKQDYRLSLEHHRLIGSLLLYKFGTYTFPGEELIRLEEEQDIDAWFEWMKRIQQYPEVDIGPVQGSFLVDWSQRPEVSVYFANEKRHPNVDGAVWVADISSLGSIIHQDMKVGEILEQFQDAVHNDKPVGVPLVFCPRKQIANHRASNQDAIYVAQMDLRCNLAEIWVHLGRAKGIQETVFLKLILPKGSVEECAVWLASKGITHNFIYPDGDETKPQQAHAGGA